MYHAGSGAVPILCRALARLQDTPDVQRSLQHGVETGDSQSRSAVLRALTDAGHRLADESSVSKLALEAGEARVRAAAFACLERCAEREVARIVSASRPEDPLLLYATGRCLVAWGEPEGVDRLFEALDRTAQEGAAAEPLQLEVRRLLADLSRTPLHSEREALRRWRLGLTSLDPRELSPWPAGL
jgi:hypothetical protein